MQDYSGRILGVSEDKLTAIATIAAVYRSWGDYVGGLWKEDLPEGLDWYVEPDAATQNLQPRPTNYRAPTWSWASVDSKVAFWTRARIEYSYVVGWVGVELDNDEVGARYPLGIRWRTKKIKASVQLMSLRTCRLGPSRMPVLSSKVKWWLCTGCVATPESVKSLAAMDMSSPLTTVVMMEKRVLRCDCWALPVFITNPANGTGWCFSASIWPRRSESGSSFAALL